MSTNASYNNLGCAYIPRMTRAQALALRTAGKLLENCVVVITDGPAIGPSLTVTEIELNPVGPSDLGLKARVHTTYDNSAWEGLYDIDLGTGTIIQLQDNNGNVVKDVDTTAAAQTVVSFPWGNVNFRDNYVEDAVMTAWNTAVGLFTNNRIVGATIDMTGKTAGNITDTEVILGSITTGPNFTSTNSRFYGSAVTVNAAATGATLISQSVINSATITRAAGAAAGTLTITQCNITNAAAVTQNGPGSIALFFTDALNGGTVSNLVATTRGLTLNACKLSRHTVRQERTLGATVDTLLGMIVEGSTLILTGAAGLVASLNSNDCIIQGTSVVTITNPTVAAVIQNAVVEAQSTLNLQTGGTFVRSRLSAEATLNTGAFSHIASIIEGQFVKTSTAANINHLKNAGFDNWV